MRISHITTGLMSIALVLAISLAAAAQTSATSPSPQSEPATAAPSSSAQPQGEPAQAAPAQSEPAQAAPSQPSMSPSQSGAAAQAGQGQAQAHAQSQGEEDNPLNLTDEQKAKLRPIVADETQQLDAVRNDSSLSAEQKVAKANQIRETASPKIKAVLTPEQLQKLADMQQKARQQQGAPSNDSQKPQQ